MALARSQVQAESESNSKLGPLACAEPKSVEGAELGAESVGACTGTSGDGGVGVVTGTVGGAIVRDGCTVTDYHAVAAFGFAAVAAVACVAAQVWSLECEHQVYSVVGTAEQTSVVSAGVVLGICDAYGAVLKGGYAIDAWSGLTKFGCNFDVEGTICIEGAGGGGVADGV
jgi:hypothetical protein